MREPISAEISRRQTKVGNNGMHVEWAGRKSAPLNAEKAGYHRPRAAATTQGRCHLVSLNDDRNLPYAAVVLAKGNRSENNYVIGGKVAGNAIQAGGVDGSAIGSNAARAIAP